MKKKEENMLNRCQYCGGRLKSKGPGDVSGWLYWKCRNKNCGRTRWIKKPPPKNIITYGG